MDSCELNSSQARIVCSPMHSPNNERDVIRPRTIAVSTQPLFGVFDAVLRLALSPTVFPWQRLHNSCWYVQRMFDMCSYTEDEPRRRSARQGSLSRGRAAAAALLRILPGERP
jgi:hypothetical protein